MGWRFRHSFKVIPGVRLNLSKSGLSCSIGGAPITMNIGPRGVVGTASLPGTGISYRHRLGTPEPRDTNWRITHPSSPGAGPAPAPVPAPAPAFIAQTPVQEVHSASTELLTSNSLKELKALIQTTYEEREDISAQLQAARIEKARATRRCVSLWNRFILKKFFPTKFAQRQSDFATASAKVEELSEQLRLTTISTLVELGREQAEPYYKLRDEFASLCDCAAVWDIRSYELTDKFHERTSAESRVDRHRVSFSLGTCDLIQWEQKVPHMQNGKGGDLFLYPGFILYRAAKEAFSVINFHDVRPTCDLVRFHETEPVPQDSKVIGQTWVKANKDGSRDRRFANNRPIPIVAYGSLSLKSTTGLWEEFQFSSPEKLTRFLHAYNAFVTSFGDHSNIY
ncbi:MAG TPA: DUF4236 domain-containing protein [Terriglobales bacterium]|nr:DUF4236 domain-containing protein [Terriglobales bacterium]